MLLGIAVNPLFGQSCCDEIVRCLLEKYLQSEEAFYDYVNSLTGRFIILIASKKEKMICQDAVGSNKLVPTSPEEWESINAGLPWDAYTTYITGSGENRREWMLIPVRIDSVHFGLQDPNPNYDNTQTMIVYEMPALGGSIFKADVTDDNNMNIARSIVDLNNGFDTEVFGADKSLTYPQLREISSEKNFQPAQSFFAQELIDRGLVGKQVLIAVKITNETRSFFTALKTGNGHTITDFKVPFTPQFVIMP